MFSCDYFQGHFFYPKIVHKIKFRSFTRISRRSNSTSTPSNTSDNASDQEFDEIRLIDVDQVSDECIEEGTDDSDDDEVSLSVYEDESDDSSSDSSSSEEDDYDSAVLQQQEEEREFHILLSNPEDLKKKIHNLLRRTRKLISIIHNSSILTSLVHDEVRRKHITVVAVMNSNNEEKSKLNELVKDFYVRWSSTYFMLIRLLALQQIINDVTYTPHIQAGLNKKQIKKLKSLANTHIDWDLLRSLSNVLAPFYLAARCLSGRKYTTLPLSYWVTQNLRSFF